MTYRIEFTDDKFERKETLKNVLSGYLSLFDKKPEIGKRVKENSLTESDLFFLRGYFSRVPSYKGREYTFLRVH